ncbi:MAG TPA: MFS transporter [Intrasporangium sp.]|uniref:MFS transporter n=1 Tax=Intrasporangium sp. TaxID=1925024 RepID=UPI002D7994E5|nr:MFS transporter [Intrasporangium sp.]HET7397051.1 MFS transporter [Intrasporangium sp.]
MTTITEATDPTHGHALPNRMPGKGSRFFPGLVFGLTFALLLSDYMSRQVLAAVFPLLKAEWGLSDTALGTLNSVVALAVGLLAVPLSVLGDRYGRARAIVGMAALWSLATLASAWASSYGELLVARILVGVGEAAYGSIGLAVVFLVFRPHLRSTLSGAFLGGGAFGSVIGVALGGVIAVRFGWRPAFVVMGVIGLVLALVYAFTITEQRLRDHAIPDPAAKLEPETTALMTKARFRTLVSTPAVIMAYLGSGLQLFMTGTLLAWLPSFFNRTYGMTPDRAGKVSALFLLLLGVGMIGTGLISDRVSRGVTQRKWTSSIVYAVLSLVFLVSAFSLGRGPAQLALLAVGAFFVSGPAGPAGAMVAALTTPSIRATAFATLALANNVLGLALGPIVTGRIADSIGLAGALRVVPWVGVLAILALVVGWRTHHSSLARLGLAGAGGATASNGSVQ